MNYKHLHFESIDSTNSYLKAHYQELDDFTFVSSDFQSKGKGRGDRVWFSDKGDNLMFSLLIRNQTLLNEAGKLSICSAVIISKVLEEYGLNNVEIKWPNDIYVNDKKICGILLEASLPEYLVIGVGLNVNQKQFKETYRKEPTSMFLELGKAVDLNELRDTIFDQIRSNLDLKSLRNQLFLDFYRTHNYLKNKMVEFNFDGQVLRGKVIDISDNCSLLVKIDSQIIEVNSGEISLL